MDYFFYNNAYRFFFLESSSLLSDLILAYILFYSLKKLQPPSYTHTF